MSQFDFTRGNSFGLEKLNLQGSDREDYEKYVEFEREKNFYLTQHSGEMEYDVTSILNNIHWGQLKLFLSEFFAIIHHMDEDVKNILYVGGANGSHIFGLAELFEDLNFHLYDTERFDKRLYRLKNVKIYKKYFDDKELEIWKKKGKIFFISDIRTLTYDPGTQTDEVRIKNEESVWNDMKLQESWIKKLRPSLSLIKFRLPFAYDFILKEGRTRNYLNGDVCFQVYNKPTSSETRLLVKDVSFKDWDIVEYERKMYYHNCVTRNKRKFLNPFNSRPVEIYSSKGLFNDFDSTYFTVLVMDFIRDYTSDEPTEKNTKIYLTRTSKGDQYLRPKVLR